MIAIPFVDFEISREKGDFLKTTIGHWGLNRCSIFQKNWVLWTNHYSVPEFFLSDVILWMLSKSGNSIPAQFQPFSILHSLIFLLCYIMIIFLHTDITMTSWMSNGELTENNALFEGDSLWIFIWNMSPKHKNKNTKTCFIFFHSSNFFPFYFG